MAIKKKTVKKTARKKRTKNEVNALIEYLTASIDRVSKIKWTDRSGEQHRQLMRWKQHRRYLHRAYDGEEE